MKLRKAVRYAQPLQRPLWVKRRNTRSEQITSAVAPIADIERLRRRVPVVQLTFISARQSEDWQGVPLGYGAEKQFGEDRLIVSNR